MKSLSALPLILAVVFSGCAVMRYRGITEVRLLEVDLCDGK